MLRIGGSGQVRPDELVELFDRYGDRLAGAASALLGPEEAEEVVQEAFLRALRFAPKRHEVRDLVAWVFVLVLNTARDVRRRRTRRGRWISTSDSDVAAVAAPAVPDPVSERELRDDVATAVASLNESERDVFLLRVAGQRTFTAIADALDIPLGTAKTRMRSALARLRRRLASYAPEGAELITRDAP